MVSSDRYAGLARLPPEQREEGWNKSQLPTLNARLPPANLWWQENKMDKMGFLLAMKRKMRDCHVQIFAKTFLHRNNSA